MGDMRSESKPINERRLAFLKEEFPEVWWEGKIDFDKLKETLGEIIDNSPERYSFTWAGKKDALRILQTPTRGTLVPSRDESFEFDDTENVFIEGENLEVLKLLYKSYFRQIKLIYIDPPYNTGKDFIYSDNFADPLGKYLELTGQKTEEGDLLTSNPETSGRYHSNWLSMMYPRLFIARQLLCDDGVIFISIDDAEVYNLRMIMNEIFGEENFIASIIWQKVYAPKSSAKHLSVDHDYIMIYAKNAEIWRPELLPRTEEADARYINSDNDPRGPWKPSDTTARNYYSKGMYEIKSPSGKMFKPNIGTYWRVSKEKFIELEKDNRIWWGEDGNNMPALKRFLSEVKQGIVPQTLWEYKDVGHTQEAKKELLEFVQFENTENVLNTVKPTRLIERILEISTKPKENNIVLDFFAGSASTAHAVIKKNRSDGGDRKFICVQLPEPLPIPEKILKTIVDIGRTRLLTVRKKYQKESKLLDEDLGYRFLKLSESNFKSWKGVKEQKIDDYLGELENHLDRIKEKWKPEDLIFEILLKEGYPLTAKITKLIIKPNEIYKVSDEENYFLICLDEEIKSETLKQLTLDENTPFVVRDTALTDEQAANLALQCTLKTI